MKVESRLKGDQPETILLIGGSGFLGSNLGQALMDAGYGLVVVDRVPPRWDSRRNEGLGRFIPISHSYLDTVSDLVASQKIDVVIHLASTLLPGSSVDELCLDITENLVPGVRLLELIQCHGIERFVFLSSGGTIYGPGDKPHSEGDPPNPLNYYGWLKLAFEELIHLKARTSALQYLILRPSNPYGRYQNLRGRQGLVSVVYGRILDKRPLEVWGDGSILKDFIQVDDFCQAFLALLRLPRWNATYNIGCGEGTSINEIIALAGEITGMPLQVEFKPSRSVDAPKTVLDIACLRRHFDKPFFSLRTGMEGYWAEIQRNGGH